MAKRRKKSGVSKFIKTTRKKGLKRRRRLSGGGVNKVFKMASNPLIGGLMGGAIGILLKNLSKKITKSENELINCGIPIVLGFLLQKKAPYLATGMIAVPALSLIGKKIPMLAEDNSVSWIDPALLSSNDDFLLSDNSPLLLAERGYSLNNYTGAVDGGMSDNEDDEDF